MMIILRNAYKWYWMMSCIIIIIIVLSIILIDHIVIATSPFGTTSSNTKTAARRWNSLLNNPNLPSLPAFFRNSNKQNELLKQSNSNNDYYDDIFNSIFSTEHVAATKVKTKKSSKDDEEEEEESQIQKISKNLQQNIQQGQQQLYKSIRNNIPPPDFFIGITPQTILSKTSTLDKKQQPRKINLQEGMIEALQELKTMRHEMEELRKELATLKQLQMGGIIIDEEKEKQDQSALVKRKKEFEKLGNEVEQWAEEILFPSNSNDNDDGWVEVECNKMLRNKFNPDGRTRTYLKWMKDSRGTTYPTADHNNNNNNSDNNRNNKKDNNNNNNIDTQEWPCIRMYTTIDAPCDEVSLYLSQEEHVTEYNTLIDEHIDLDNITKQSKICYARTPQILFIKPRDFITYCYYRYKNDGTQIVLNQACDTYDNKKANAYAFRGATYICPHPDNPINKTYIAMLAHASPGRDIPAWACKTAVQSLAPIEPYRLFYKINQGVLRYKNQLHETCSKNNINDVEMVNSGSNSTVGKPKRRKNAPAGLAQMGYACFWPNGGCDDDDDDDDNNNNKNQISGADKVIKNKED